MRAPAVAPAATGAPSSPDSVAATSAPTGLARWAPRNPARDRSTGTRTPSAEHTRRPARIAARRTREAPSARACASSTSGVQGNWGKARRCASRTIVHATAQQSSPFARPTSLASNATPSCACMRARKDRAQGLGRACKRCAAAAAWASPGTPTCTEKACSIAWRRLAYWSGRAAEADAEADADGAPAPTAEDSCPTSAKHSRGTLQGSSDCGMVASTALLSLRPHAPPLVARCTSAYSR